MAILVLDIGGSAVKNAWYVNNEMKHQEDFETPKTRTEFIEHIQELINKAEFPLDGVAISCPGDIDQKTGTVNGTSFVPFLHFTPLRPQLEAAFGCPVSLYNDAHSAALAEMTSGVGKQTDHPLFVIVGSGIGVALVQEGQVREVFDSLEDKSEKLLVDIIRSVNGISASPVQSAKLFSLKKFELPSTYNGKDVFEMAKQEDPQALSQLDTMFTSLANILLALDHVVKPEFIALGGGVTNHPDFLTSVQQKVAQLQSDQPFMVKLMTWIDDQASATEKTLDIRLCQYKNDANLYGALTYFQTNKNSV